MATATIPIRPKGQTTCKYHKGRQLEFYCEQCLDLVCPQCLSTIHKKHSICELTEITPQRKGNIKRYIDRTEQCDLVQIGKCIASTDALLAENDRTFDQLSHQLRMQTEKIKQDLDKLTAETISLYQKMSEDNNKLIQKYKNDLDMYDKQLKQHVQECKSALQQGSPIEIYDTECEIDSRIHLPVKPTLGTASFTPNKHHRCHLELALGTVTTSHQGQTSPDQDRSVSSSEVHRQFSAQRDRDTAMKTLTRTKLCKETKVVKELKSPCFITSICPTMEDEVWTCCNYSNTIIRLDKNGTVIQQVTQKADTIKDISTSPQTRRLWACDNESNILELVSGQLTSRFRTKKTPSCICVTTDDHIIVGMSKQISKYTTQGRMILTTMAAATLRPFVFTPHRITECPVTNNIAVIDFNDESDGGDGNSHIVVMNIDFNELFVYSAYGQTQQRDVEQFDPHAIMYDSEGNLTIGDKHSCRIQYLAGDGGVRRILHTDNDWVVALGMGRKNLLWTVIGYDHVKVLRYICDK